MTVHSKTDTMDGPQNYGVQAAQGAAAATRRSTRHTFEFAASKEQEAYNLGRISRSPGSTEARAEGASQQCSAHAEAEWHDGPQEDGVRPRQPR